MERGGRPLVLEGIMVYQDGSQPNDFHCSSRSKKTCLTGLFMLGLFIVALLD
jgi:hypothetical protein